MVSVAEPDEVAEAKTSIIALCQPMLMNRLSQINKLRSFRDPQY